MAKKNNGGRPTRYKKEYARQAKLYCAKAGAIDEDLAELFDVTKQTIQNWKKAHPAFKNALDAGKAVSDDLVEQALYSRAIGATVIETKVGFYEGNATQEEIQRHYPPDVGACMSWLCNRRPEKWKRAPDAETAEGLNVNLILNKPNAAN